MGMREMFLPDLHLLIKKQNHFIPNRYDNSQHSFLVRLVHLVDMSFFTIKRVKEFILPCFASVISSEFLTTITSISPPSLYLEVKVIG